MNNTIWIPEENKGEPIEGGFTKHDLGAGSIPNIDVIKFERSTAIWIGEFLRVELTPEELDSLKAQL